MSYYSTSFLALIYCVSLSCRCCSPCLHCNALCSHDPVAILLVPEDHWWISMLVWYDRCQSFHRMVRYFISKALTLETRRAFKKQLRLDKSLALQEVHELNAWARHTLTLRVSARYFTLFSHCPWRETFHDADCCNRNANKGSATPSWLYLFDLTSCNTLGSHS